MRSVSALLLLSLISAPAQAGTLDQAVATASRKLQASWTSDPVTKGIPWPEVKLLSAGTTPNQACPSAAVKASTALFFPGSKKVLLDRSALEGANEIQGAGGVAFWVAFGLAQALGDHPPSTEPLPPPAANMQTTCIAGAMLSSMANGKQGQQEPFLREALRTVLAAYSSTSTPLQGNPQQRGYALLSGTGGTRSDCSAAAMGRLARGRDQLPDPELFDRVETVRGAALGIDVFCRQSCRPGLGNKVGVGGI